MFALKGVWPAIGTIALRGLVSGVVFALLLPLFAANWDMAAKTDWKDGPERPANCQTVAHLRVQDYHLIIKRRGTHHGI